MNAKATPEKLNVRLKYTTLPDQEEADKKAEESKKVVEEPEFEAYRFPPDMYTSSRLILTEKNIEAAEEYLQKAQMFHHLWQPDDEIADIKKAILIHNDVKERRRKKEEQQALMKKIV
jgi:hypothetical protein